MLLRALRIDSFKSYRDETVPLGPLSMLVGPNGSGKTSVLQGIEFMGGLVRGTLGEQLRGRDWEYRDLPWLRGSTQRFGFTAELELDGSPLIWTLRFGHRRRPGVDLETIELADGTRIMHRDGRSMWRLDRSTGEREEIKQTLTSSWLATLEQDDQARFPELVVVADWARGIQPYVTLDPAILRAPSRRSSEGLGPRGENLAGFLRWLRDHSPKRFATMLERVRARYPNLQQLFLTTSGYGWFSLTVEERWGNEPVRLSASQVSDGLLRLIAVAALHEVERPPSVMMIDEIENGLHPHLLSHVIEMLEELATSTPIQVVLTTHNPIAVNFAADSSHVLVVWRREQGQSVVRRLDETRGFDRLGRHFDAGEVWHNVGKADLVGSAAH